MYSVGPFRSLASSTSATSREGTGGYRLNVGTQWSVLGGQSDEDQGQGAPGLRLMIDLFGEQADTGLEPTERRMGLLGRIEFR